MKSLTLLLCLGLFFTILASSAMVHAKSQKFAVLVATTKSWIYYRHQSQVMKAFHTLVANGFKKENIITMYYDDIANDPRNLEPGVVRNHPFGPNLVDGIQKNYIGDKVNAETFLAVLNGDAQKAGGPVLKSGPKDKIFIFITGLGAHELITFPTGPALAADKFASTLKKLKADNKAKKIYVNLDVGYASSIPYDRFTNDKNIFISTATHIGELPYPAFCYADKKLCYATLYGAAWTTHSDRLRQLKYGRRQSLFDQYNFVRTINVFTHVSMFGDVSMGKSRLKEFLNYKLERKPKNMNVISQLGESVLQDLDAKLEEDPDNEDLLDKFNHLSVLYDGVPQKDEVVSLDLEIETADSLKTMHEHDIAPAFMDAHQKANLLEKRETVKETMKNVLSLMDLDFDKALPEKALSASASDNYEKAIAAFSAHCFNINENPHVLQYLSKLARINELGIPLEKQIASMKEVCTDAHREMESIH